MACPPDAALAEMAALLAESVRRLDGGDRAARAREDGAMPRCGDAAIKAERRLEKRLPRRAWRPCSRSTTCARCIGPPRALPALLAHRRQRGRGGRAGRLRGRQGELRPIGRDSVRRAARATRQRSSTQVTGRITSAAAAAAAERPQVDPRRAEDVVHERRAARRAPAAARTIADPERRPAGLLQRPISRLGRVSERQVEQVERLEQHGARDRRRLCAGERELVVRTQRRAGGRARARNSASATAVSVSADDQRCGRAAACRAAGRADRAAGARMTSGSAASKASGSASATATIRLIQRICTGCDGQQRLAVSQREREHGDRDDQRLAQAGRQHEAERLDEVVVDAPALLDRGAQGAEVVVGEHHVGGLLGRGGAPLPHRHADVGLTQRGRVVDAVARHRDDLALRLQRAHEPSLCSGATRA